MNTHFDVQFFGHNVNNISKLNAFATTYIIYLPLASEKGTGYFFRTGDILFRPLLRSECDSSPNSSLMIIRQADLL